MAQRMSDRSAYVLLILVMMMWASGVIIARVVHDLTPPVGFSFWRWVMVVALLAPFALPALRRQSGISRQHIRAFVPLGIFMAGGSTLLVWSAQHTSASNVALISAAQPTVTLFIGWMVTRQRFGLLELGGVMAAFAGIVVIITRLDLSALADIRFNTGDMLILLAVIFYAGYAINLHRWVSGLSGLIILYMTACAGLLVVAPFYLVESYFVAPMNFDREVLLAALYMAAIPSALAIAMWNTAVGVVGPNRASAFMNLLPLFGTGFAVVLLDEKVYSYHLIGALLVCLGISMVIVPGFANAVRS